MESVKLRLIICFLFAWICGCKQREAPYVVMERRFNLFKPELKKMVSLLNEPKNRNYSYESPLTNTEAFDATISKKLKSIGITAVSRQFARVPKDSPQIYIFITNWVVGDSVSIVYDPPDSLYTQKGSYRKDANGNEVWGLGDRWQISKIIKYLR
ncbi:MAG: hypothetical protein JWQ27_371 [Ferruginibacter sp.]|nr:hypothetical protein [Ferruginibacter sp.]